ncbi:MAG: Hsp20/alpha crystallin family protein [Candidatus Helarchaeota archaeon]
MGSDNDKKEEKEKKEWSLSPWHGWWSRPFDMLSEFDQIFDDFRSGLRRFFTSSFEPITELTKVPAVDIVDAGDKYILKADMPGMDKGDINIEVRNDVLSITAEKKEEEEEKGKTFIRKERRYRSFSRSIPLPKGIDPDNIKASLDKGILQITIPKLEKEEPPKRKIEIQ